MSVESVGAVDVLEEATQFIFQTNENEHYNFMKIDGKGTGKPSKVQLLLATTVLISGPSGLRY